jgi:serine phosphatase RsbU (regulator of sigma subunit)
VIFSLKELHIENNDSVYLYSDGYIDQLGGEENKRYMIKRFKEFILEISNKSMSEQKQLFSENLTGWKGDSDQTDDILIFGIHF